MNSIDLFVKNWGSNKSMAPINAVDITELESKFDILLPDDYKYLISTYGLVHSPNVFTKICDLNSPVSDVQDFLSLEDVCLLSKLYEMNGMPKGHILFASDCKGNMFCFKQDDCKNKGSDSAVWYFDYDLCIVKKIANSFIEWLDEFNKLSTV